MTPSQIERRQAIALLALQSDPALQKMRQIGTTLARLGWQIDIFTSAKAGEPPSIAGESPYCRLIYMSPNDGRNVEEFAEALSAFQNQQGLYYPLIHTCGMLSGKVGLELQRSRKMLWVHSEATTGIGILAPDIVKGVDRLIASYPQQQQYWQQRFPKVAIDLIPYHTQIHSPSTLSKLEARQRLGWGSEPALLYVGRLSTLRESYIFLQAWRSLRCQFPNLQLFLVDIEGESQHGQDCEPLIWQLDGQKIGLLASLDPAHLPLCYAAADVCVIPSHYEPFGEAAIAATAWGTPIVASNVGGLRFTVLPEETGLLVPPLDAEAWRDAIARILADELWVKRSQKQPWISRSAIQLSDLYRRLFACWFVQETLPDAIASQQSAMTSESLGQVS
ncbi:MAG: glycosyltransferase [Spirulina sp.]